MKAIQTDLIGQTVAPAGEQRIQDGAIGWPDSFRPNLTGEYMASVRGVYVVGDDVMLMLVDPFGNTASMPFSWVKVVLR